MGFDNFFDHRSKFRKYDHHYDKHHDDYHEHGYQQGYRGGYGHDYTALNIISKIWNNPKLRLTFIFAAVIVVVLIIIVLIAIIPFILKILDSIAQTGLKGATESITGFLEKIWNGSGN